MSASSAVRPDGRLPEDLRPVEIVPGFLRHAEGSASIRQGRTWVVCTASVEDRQPPFLKGTGRGWVTAEYGMLPRSVGVRLPRNRPSGRHVEIQRLVGRSLRAVVDLDRLPQHTITIDCDVIEADGGTRAAAITGAFVALCDAMRWMIAGGRMTQAPLRGQVAAISVGLVRGLPCCDLTYDEDSNATVDMNLVSTSQGKLVGVQAGVEGEPIEEESFQTLLRIACECMPALFTAQRKALGIPLHGPFDPAFLKARPR